MNDRITIDGVVYVRAGVQSGDDEIVFDDWQERKVKTAWDAVHKAEEAAREAKKKWQRDNPSRIVCGMIRAFYESADEGFDEYAREFVEWAERNYGDFDEYTSFIRATVCREKPGLVPMGKTEGVNDGK